MSSGFVFGPSSTSVALVMSADLIIIGVHSGCRFLSSAANPATCGLDIDVPLYRLKEKPALGGVGETAAMMSCPGAMMSGLSRSPPPAVNGPRDEKAALHR